MNIPNIHEFICPVCHASFVQDKPFKLHYCPYCALDIEAYNSGRKHEYAHSDKQWDCEKCIHRVPILDKENGVWKGAECDSWDCKFVSRKEALRAWYEVHRQAEW